MRLAGVTLVALVLGAAARAAEADSQEAAKAAGVFQSLYGEELKRVAAPRDLTDDLVLVGEYGFRKLSAPGASGRFLWSTSPA
jgi:hypothetical protein